MRSQLLKKYNQLSKTLNTNRRKRKLGTKNYKDLPYHEGKILPKNCLNLYASAWFKPNFDLIGCSSSHSVLGNLLKNDFDEIWNNSNLGYVKLRKTFAAGKVPDNCKNCIYTGGFLS